MDTKTFLEYFEHIADAPNGVQRMRKLILTLAIQGKLVPQNPNDKPASELLKEIGKEKERLVIDGLIKQPKPLPAIKAEELPYELPNGWKWVRLGDITEIVRGITFPASEKTKEPAQGRIGCLRTANVQKDIEWDDLLFINEDFIRKDAQYICKHDIVMSMANSRELVGKVAIVKVIPTKKATFGGFLGVIRTFRVLQFYILNLLTTDYARTSLIDSASQTTNIANVSLGKLNPFLVPLPPLEEQKRIVAKVDQLMALCDQLETQQKQKAQTRVALNNTALDKLLTAITLDEFNHHWQRIANNFHHLLAS